MSEALKQTALYDWHLAHGGRLVPFAGWEMPVQYPLGPIEEHHLTRRSAGLFDIDHMGQITVTGPQAETYLNHLVTWDITLIDENKAHYALLCDEQGGIIDDIFIYHLPERWLVVVNADNLEKDFAWLQEHTPGYEATVTDISPETYMLALQGPQAIPLLQSLTEVNLTALPRFSALETNVGPISSLIGRTGYTGEDGVELFFPASQALEMWEQILAAGPASGIEVGPIGLAARDSLRFEPGFALYGHEISAEITPLEARLGWACKFDNDFIGRAALLAQKETGLTKKLISFELTEKGVPRQGYPLTTLAGQEIGTVVTGLYAPTVEKYCGNAFVQPDYAAVGTELRLLIRNKAKAAVVSQRPFYTPAYRK
jgi:glycine cleavage system T protein